MNIKPQQMEMFVASHIAERLGGSDRLMERILERGNIISAWKRVRANKGAPGIDGMSTGSTWEIPGEALAENRKGPAKWDSQANAGEEETDPQTGWRGSFTGNSHGA